MLKVLAALAVLALSGPVPALAVKPARAPATAKPAAAKPTAKSRPKAPVDRGGEKVPVPPSEAANRVIDWIALSGNNHALPYIIVDKNAAHAFLFDGKGRFLAGAPVLIGIATGDDATPGVGKKSLAEIGPAEKTTPAGRFLAKFGIAAGHAKVLWVDYATSVALHPIPTGNPKERRRERMLSPDITDNRITFGCINVPTAFYSRGVAPLFQRKGGYVYVLPDTRPIEEVFPPLRVLPFLSGGAS